MAKWDLDKLPPGREPLRADWFVEKLGASTQRVMSLMQANADLKTALERADARAEYLEEAVLEILLDLKEGRNVEEIQAQVYEHLNRLDEMLEGED